MSGVYGEQSGTVVTVGRHWMWVRPADDIDGVPSAYNSSALAHQGPEAEGGVEVPRQR
jgi:hypothetical protein